MTEIELKILLDAETDERLRRHPALAAMRVAPARTETLVSVYYDTPDDALAQAGIALRLRRAGRRWEQTVKAARAQASGLHAAQEVTCPAPGGRLNLGGADPQGVYAAIAAALDGAEPQARYETRVKRRVERLRPANGGVVELALDRGEVIAGPLSAPIREAEMELVEGGVGAIFDVARTLFTEGPIHFSTLNKAARARRLAREGAAEPPLVPRNAGDLAYAPEATVESVARDVLRDCFAQVATNMAVIAASEDDEGPHQLRVGLRRLRTAFSVFGPSVGKTALASLSERARELGKVVGGLRDLDVLIHDLVEATAAQGLDQPAREALTAALTARRDAVRTEVRATLAAPEAVRFLFDLAEVIEARGWLAPSDYDQTARLAAPIGEVAPIVLNKRLKRVRKLGKGIETRTPEELHELRKELKKLRYAVDALAPNYAEKRVAGYLKALKALQDHFGSLNDAATAASLLGPPDGPAPTDPDAQRAVGWVLGRLALRVEADRPGVFARWQKLAAAKPFWH